MLYLHQNQRIDEMRRWLQHNIEPNGIVEEYMTLTARARLRDLQDENTSISDLLSSIDSDKPFNKRMQTGMTMPKACTCDDVALFWKHV